MAVKIITMEIVSKKSGKAIEVSFPMDESLFKASFSLPKKKRILFLTEAYHEFKREEKMKLLFGNRYNHEFDDYIYVFENGDLVRPNWVTACFKRLLDDNNMPHIRFHDLRHSCATLLRHQGVPMEDISKWLGHSNLLTTEQVYAHYDDMKKSTTLKALSSALDNDKDDKKEMS